MSEKYKREIEEILRQAGEKPPGKGRKTGKRSLLRNLWVPSDNTGAKKLRISPGRIAIVATLVLLSAIVFWYMVPAAATPLFWLALLLFIAAYAYFLARPQAQEKRWRGRSVSYNKSRLTERMRRWFKK